MRRTITIMVIVAVIIAFVELASAADVVKIGVVDVRSGAYKNTGDRVLWGLEFVVEEANEAGGILGKKIELVVEDHQMKPEIAVEKAKKLILKDKVAAIIQSTSSGVGLALAKLMPRYKMIFLCTGAEATRITGEDFTPYTFRTCLHAAIRAKGMSKYFASTPYRKVYLIHQDYAWGHDMSKYYKKYILEYAPDTEIVGDEFHPLFTKDFAPYINKIRASGADYIFTGNWGTDLAQLIVQSRSLGLNQPFGTCFLDDDSDIKVIGDAAMGCVTNNLYILGAGTPEGKAFEEKYYKRMGRYPSVQEVKSYIGLEMYFEAVRKAGSFDMKAVMEAFEGLEWQGPTCKIEMRKEDHQVQHGLVIAEAVEKTKYFDHIYVKPIQLLSPEDVSVSPEESGWKPWEGR